MKAPSFAYAKPRSLGEAFELLARPGAKVLAGGQSLVPTLNMRLSSPDILVDITALDELKGIAATASGLRIGALVTHAEVGSNALVAKHAPLLAQAVPHIAHPAIRNRGTIGGSLALADPAAEYPACVLALNAVLILRSSRGERRVPAESFFKGLFETAIEPGDLLAAVEIPASTATAFHELARRHGDYAIVGLAGAVVGGEKRIAYFGAGATPVLARGASKARTLEEAKEALADDLDPPADLYNTSATKRHLAAVLLERAWNTLSKPH